MIDLSSATSAFASLQSMGYFFLFLIFIVEGPITNYVAAFAASLGLFNVYIVFFLVILGNLVGDIIPFFIGKLGKKAAIEKYLHKSLKPEKIKQLKAHLRNNPGKALTVIKLAPILPFPGIILAGMVDIPVKTFVFYSFIISAGYAFVVTVLGYYSGAAFNLIFRYFQYGIYLGGALIILIIFLGWLIFKRISEKVEKI